MRARSIDLFSLPVLIVVLIALGGLYVAINGGIGPKDDGSPEAAPAAIDRTEEMQERRIALIRKLAARGVFSKIDGGGTVLRVYTGPVFDGLPFDQKQSFCSVIYAYHFDGRSGRDFLIVHDGRTGKKIGTFDSAGLRMH